MKSVWYTCKTEIFQSAFVSFKMIIDTESLVILFQSTELAQEREIFSRVLTYNISITKCQEQIEFVGWTFWVCCAIKRTSEKSYIPRATSNNVSASTRKIMYLTASSTAVGTRSTRRYNVRFRHQ